MYFQRGVPCLVKKPRPTPVVRWCITNYRISKKIYKRADFKLKSFIAANYDKRTTYDIAKEENILSGLERSIFISKQDKWTKRINNIVDELKAEEQIMDEEMQR